MSPHHPRCFANHMGVWACESRFFHATFAAIKSGQIQPRPVAMEDDDDRPARKIPPFVGALAAEPVSDASRRVLYFLTREGVAIIDVQGSLMKTEGKYTDTSTVHIRRALSAALADDRVFAIMLHIDSPGGAAAGTQEVADDIAAATKVKPMASHADDLIASAAYWIGAATGRVTINAAGEAGSIGVYMVLHDQSEQYKTEGIEAIVVGSGDMKGAGYPGTKVTDEQKTYFQGLVDNVNGFFTTAVRKHRGMSEAQVAAVNTGRVYSATDAKTKGLVDDIMPFEKAVADLAKIGAKAHRAAKASTRDALQVAVEIEAAE